MTVIAVVVLAAIISVVLAITATEAKKAEMQQRQKAEMLAKQQEEDLYFNHIAMAHQELKANRPVHALNLLSKCPKHLRHWEWHYLQRMCHFQDTPFIEFDSPIVAFAFNPDGSKLAALCVDGRLVIRDFLTGRESSLQVREPSSTQLVRDADYQVTQWIAFSPDRKCVAIVGDGNSVEVISLASGKVEQTLSGHAGFITEIAFAPDGNRLAAIGFDNIVSIWDHRNGKLLRTLSLPFGAYALAFSPDGELLLGGYPLNASGPYMLCFLSTICRYGNGDVKTACCIRR